MNFAFKFQFNLPECPWFSTLILKTFSWPSKMKLVSFGSCFTLRVTILMGDCLWPPQLGKRNFHSEGPGWHNRKTHFSPCKHSTIWETVNKDFALVMTMQKPERLSPGKTILCVCSHLYMWHDRKTDSGSTTHLEQREQPDATGSMGHCWKVFRSVTWSQGSERS